MLYLLQARSSVSAVSTLCLRTPQGMQPGALFPLVRLNLRKEASQLRDRGGPEAHGVAFALTLVCLPWVAGTHFYRLSAFALAQLEGKDLASLFAPSFFQMKHRLLIIPRFDLSIQKHLLMLYGCGLLRFWERATGTSQS